MRKPAVFASVFAVSLIVCTGFAQAAASAPAWSNVCWWKYNIKIRNGGLMSSAGVVWYNVSKTTTRNVNGTTYDVFEQTTDGAGTVSVTTPPMSGTFRMAGFHWVEETTYRTVELNESMIVTVYVPVMTRYDNTGYDGPEDFFNFDIDEGQVWYSNSTVYRESVMLSMLSPTIDHNDSVVLSNNKYTCQKHGTFTVAAGSFDGYKVNQTSLRGGSYVDYIYSPTVGNVISQNSTLRYDATSVTVITLELADYNYGAAPEFGLVAPVAGIAVLAGTAIVLRFGPSRKE